MILRLIEGTPVFEATLIRAGGEKTKGGFGWGWETAAVVDADRSMRVLARRMSADSGSSLRDVNPGI